jgi:hypothetical protein
MRWQRKVATPGTGQPVVQNVKSRVPIKLRMFEQPDVVIAILPPVNVTGASACECKRDGPRTAS